MVMLLQRVWYAENQAENKPSNGPRRVQSNLQSEEYSVTCRHTSVVRDMIVSHREHSIPCESRWHRG